MKTIRRWYKYLFPVLLVFTYLALAANSDCDGNSSADNANTVITNNQQDIYNKSQPIHTYNYSMPRDVLQQIYDATMEAHNTWTVFFAFDKPVFACASVGFPVVGGTQLTNPDKTVNYNGNITTLPQAEPNGLFPPGANSGTWVLCLHDGKAVPIYSEPDTITYPFPVKVENGQIVDMAGASTINISINATPVPQPSPSGTPTTRP